MTCDITIFLTNDETEFNMLTMNGIGKSLYLPVLLSRVRIGIHSLECAVREKAIYAQAARDGYVCQTQITIWQISGSNAPFTDLINKFHK